MSFYLNVPLILRLMERSGKSFEEIQEKLRKVDKELKKESVKRNESR